MELDCYALFSHEHCQLTAQCLQHVSLDQIGLCRCSVSLVTECIILLNYEYYVWLLNHSGGGGAVVFKLKLKIVKLFSVLPLYQEICQCAQTVRGCICVFVSHNLNVQMVNNKDIVLNSFTIKKDSSVSFVQKIMIQHITAYHLLFTVAVAKMNWWNLNYNYMKFFFAAHHVYKHIYNCWATGSIRFHLLQKVQFVR